MKPQLTARQQDVIELLAQGQQNKEIARHLRMGLGTVKVHLSLAYQKLGARNRTEAASKFLSAREALEE